MAAFDAQPHPSNKGTKMNADRSNDHIIRLKTSLAHERLAIVAGPRGGGHRGAFRQSPVHIWAAILLTLAACGGTANHSPGVSTERAATESAALQTQPVVYHGGPILQPELITVYWGTFSQDQINSFQTWLNGFATYLSGSTAPPGQQPTVGQYGVRGARVGVYYHDPDGPPQKAGPEPQVLDTAEQQEVQRLQNTMCGAQPCLPKENGERVYIVLINGFRMKVGNGPGQVSAMLCGANGVASDGTGNWMVITQEMKSNPCGTSVGAMEANLSHEIQEVITDPGSHGWNQGTSNGQIGDNTCQGQNISMTFGPMQQVYDDVQDGQCTAWTTEQLSQINAVTQTSGGVTYLDVFGLDGNHSVQHRRWQSNSGWQAAWENLGGTFTSPPVAVAGAEGGGTVDVFAQGTDNSFYRRTWNGTAWTNWDNAPFIGNTFNGQPAVVSWGMNRIDVFGEGTDGAYYHIAWNGTSWTSLELVGGTFNGPPTAVSRGLNSIDLFGRGTDGNYYRKSYDGTVYTPSGTTNWEQPSASHTFISEPVVAVNGGGLDAFGQGTDWSYYHLAWSSQSKRWTALEGLGSTFNGPPAAAWQSPNTLDVIGQGTDGQYYHLQQLNGTWAAIEAVNGSGFGAGAVVTPVSGNLNLFIQGTDQAVYFKSLQGTAWSAWNPLGGSLH